MTPRKHFVFLLTKSEGRVQKQPVILIHAALQKLLPYWQLANNTSQAINSPLPFALHLWKFITEINLNCGHENAHILTSNTTNCSAASQGHKSWPAWTCLR